MQCSAPLVGIDVPGFRRNRFDELVMVSNTVTSRKNFLSKYRYKVHESYSEETGFWSTRQDLGEDIFTGKYRFYDVKGNEVFPYPVPCGTCFNCRIRKSAEWADRMTMEICTSSYPCWFVTLTYDDKYVPWNDDGTSLTLSREDADRFIKNYQMYCYRHGLTPRHFLSGEYGSKTFRPHYHCILFDLPLDDLEYYGNNFRGDVFFTSHTVSSWWSGKGFILLAHASWETAAYTARYVTKKMYGKLSDLYEEANILPEFQLQSNRPGIGHDFFVKNREKIMHDGGIVLPSGRICCIPQYFDRLYQDFLQQYPYGEDGSESLALSEDYLAFKEIRKKNCFDSFVEKMHVLQIPEKKYFDILSDQGKIVNKKLKRSLDMSL